MDTLGNTTTQTTYKNPPPAHATKHSTREHKVFECQAYDEHRAIITKGAPDHQLATLFGTKAGIDALAEFVKNSKAFQKQKTQANP